MTSPIEAFEHPVPWHSFAPMLTQTSSVYLGAGAQTKCFGIYMYKPSLSCVTLSAACSPTATSFSIQITKFPFFNLSLVRTAHSHPVNAWMLYGGAGGCDHQLWCFGCHRELVNAPVITNDLFALFYSRYQPKPYSSENTRTSLSDVSRGGRG